MAKVNKRGKAKPLVLESGRVISDEVAEELADEAERADFANARPVFPGRPSLSGSGTSPKFSFRITPQLYLAVEKRAEAEGRSISDLARTALAAYMDREEK